MLELRSDFDRYLDAAAPPAWSVETQSGSFPANVARSAAHQSIRLSISFQYVGVLEQFGHAADSRLSFEHTKSFLRTRVCFESGSIGEHW